MALTMEEKNKLVSSGAVKQYAGKSWDEIEKILKGNSSESTRLNNEINNIRTNNSSTAKNNQLKTPGNTVTSNTKPPASVNAIKTVSSEDAIANAIKSGVLEDSGNGFYWRYDSKGNKVGSLSKNAAYKYFDKQGNYVSNPSKVSGYYNNSGNIDPLEFGLAMGTIEERKGNYILHDRNGRSISVRKDRVNEYIDSDGYWDSEKYYKERTEKNGGKTSNNYAANAVSGAIKTNLNDLDSYRKLAANMLKPQFDKAVEEQMKQFTNRMVAQGYQGQLPAEAMRAQIMSDMQADYESQVSALAQQLMQQDIANERYEREWNYQVDRDKINDARYKTEYADRRADIDYERKQNELTKSQQAEINNIMAYYPNIQAEIDKRENNDDPSDDFLIPYLKALRQEKIIKEGLDQNGNKITVSPGKLTFDQALKLWQTYGVATPGIAEALGVEVGAKTEDYLNTAYDINKPYFKPDTGGSSSGTATAKAQDSYYNGFIAENMNTDGESLYANLVNNQQAYINNMGADNFMKAIEFAREKYYQAVINRWRGNEAALLAELQKKPEYYQQVLGIERYNKLISNLSGE